MDMNAHVKALVDQAPPPTPEMIARLRLILTGAMTTQDTEGGADAAA